jgi:hypothetical protein
MMDSLARQYGFLGKRRLHWRALVETAMTPFTWVVV